MGLWARSGLWVRNGFYIFKTFVLRERGERREERETILAWSLRYSLPDYLQKKSANPWFIGSISVLQMKKARPRWQPDLPKFTEAVCSSGRRIRFRFLQILLLIPAFIWPDIPLWLSMNFPSWLYHLRRHRVVSQCDSDMHYPEVGHTPQDQGTILHKTALASDTSCKFWGS